MRKEGGDEGREREAGGGEVKQYANSDLLFASTPLRNYDIGAVL